VRGWKVARRGPFVRSDSSATCTSGRAVSAGAAAELRRNFPPFSRWLKKPWRDNPNTCLKSPLIARGLYPGRGCLAHKPRRSKQPVGVRPLLVEETTFRAAPAVLCRDNQCAEKPRARICRSRVLAVPQAKALVLPLNCGISDIKSGAGAEFAMACVGTTETR